MWQNQSLHKKCYFGANAAKRPPPRNGRPLGQSQNQRKQETRNEANETVQAAAQTLN